MIHNIAHRGASALEPENTLRAFERAIGMGATMLEVDVHLSRDGRLVVVHDADLSRTTNGQGQVSDLTLAQIRRFDAGLGEHVPTLAQAIELARGRVELYVELKGHRTSEPTIRALRDQNVLDQAVVGSFCPRRPQEAKFLAPAIRTSLLIRQEDRHRDFVGWAQHIEASFVHPCWERAVPTPHKLLTPELIASVRRRGLGLIVWNEVRPAELRQLVRLDVHGICTDIPDVLSSILSEERERDIVWRPTTA